MKIKIQQKVSAKVQTKKTDKATKTQDKKTKQETSKVEKKSMDKK